MNSDPTSEPPPIPPPSGARLDYQQPGPPPGGSQWYTDEHAYGAALVYALMGFAVVIAMIGGVWWLVSHFSTFF